MTLLAPGFVDIIARGRLSKAILSHLWQTLRQYVVSQCTKDGSHCLCPFGNTTICMISLLLPR